MMLLLTTAIAVCTVPAAFAASDEAKDAADILYEQGLFLGNGTTATGAPNFELDRKPTRYEAVTMLVRLLGKEEEAKKGTWNTPFTDVDEWAKPYVGYAYANKLTTGTSETIFSGNDTVTASEYLTLVLRVLGYNDKIGDFSWDKAWELSDEIGLTNGQYNANTRDFTRGDVAIASKNALNVNLKNDNKTLGATLRRNKPAADINTSKSVVKPSVPTQNISNERPSYSETDNSYNSNSGKSLIAEENDRHQQVLQDLYRRRDENRNLVNERIREIRAENIPYMGSESEYERRTSELIRKTSTLQSRINTLALDDSRDAIAERKKKEQELAEAQKELDDLTARYAAKNAIASLEELQKNYEDDIASQIDKENALHQRNLERLLYE
ncbi:MAG: hypothetical protein HFI72_02455 [Peptococcaceae bacterium]|nr:hypothetical protein [Peptococcaceae bacterium]